MHYSTHIYTYETRWLAEGSHDTTKEHVQCAATNVPQPMSVSGSLHPMLLLTTFKRITLLPRNTVGSNNWLPPSSPDMPRSAQQPRSPVQSMKPPIESIDADTLLCSLAKCNPKAGTSWTLCCLEPSNANRHSLLFPISMSWSATNVSSTVVQW